MDFDPRDGIATEREDPAARGPRADRDPPPARGLLHGIFEERADATPGAPAVVEGGALVSYGDLERRANRIARLLRARGVRSGDLVAHLLPRSADAYAALLGILKAGGRPTCRWTRSAPRSGVRGSSRTATRPLS